MPNVLNIKKIGQESARAVIASGTSDARAIDVGLAGSPDRYKLCRG
jgi:hypothetical protein